MTRESVLSRADVDWGLFLLLVVASQGLSGFLPGDPSRTSILLSSVLLVFLVVRDLTRAFRTVSLSPLVLFFGFWFVCAALLSSRPTTSLYAALVLVLMLVYAVVRRSTTDATLQTFAIATSVSLVPSIIGLVTPIFVPVFTHAGSSGGYAGYFPWNSTAGLCAAAALLSTFLAFLAVGFKWWQLPCAAGALLMLVLADSATTQVTLLAAVGVLVGVTVLRRVRASSRPIVILVLGVLGISLLAKAVGDFTVLARVSEATGRAETVSGRTPIWEYALDGISDSPFWGYGSTFWDSLWKNSAHNGFLDIALSGGVPAAVAFAAIVLIAAVRLAIAASPMLPMLIFGVVANLALSQAAVPSVASLALLLAVGAAASLGKDALGGIALARDDDHHPQSAGRAALQA